MQITCSCDHCHTPTPIRLVNIGLFSCDVLHTTAVALRESESGFVILAHTHTHTMELSLHGKTMKLICAPYLCTIRVVTIYYLPHIHWQFGFNIQHCRKYEQVCSVLFLSLSSSQPRKIQMERGMRTNAHAYALVIKHLLLLIRLDWRRRRRCRYITEEGRKRANERVNV